MEFLAIRDRLTGLYNQAHLQERIETEIARAERHSGTFALIFIHLDEFDEFNEMYGHENGNLAVLAIVQAIRGDLRASDVIFRTGGDELAVFLPEAGRAGAEVAANKILRAIRRLDWPDASGHGGPIELSVTIAVVAYPTDGETKEALGASALRAFEEAQVIGGRSVAMV